jgi:hypothetical protein
MHSLGGSASVVRLTLLCACILIVSGLPPSTQIIKAFAQDPGTRAISSQLALAGRALFATPAAPNVSMTVWAWGDNAGGVWGDLGDGTTTNPSTPEQVHDLSGVQAVAAGYFRSFALLPLATSTATPTRMATPTKISTHVPSSGRCAHITSFSS